MNHTFTINVNLRHFQGDAASPSELPQVLGVITNLKDTIMDAIQTLQTETTETGAAVTNLISVVEAQSATILGLQVRLDEAIAAGVNPDALAAIKADLDAIQARAAAAVAAAGGVPPAA